MEMKPRRLQLESLEGRQMMATLYPGLSVADVTVNEGAKTVTATITRSDTGYLTGTVDWSLKPGTAGTADYRAASGRVTFQPRETSKPITIAITDDLLAEATEEFFLQLSNPKWGKIVDGTASIKIVDNDKATPPPDPDPPTDPPPTDPPPSTGARGPQQGVTAPVGAIVVTPSTTNLISSAPAGATLFFRAGTYDITISPKVGQTFIGEYGAILKSSTKQFAFRSTADNVTIRNLTIDGYRPGQWYFGAIQADRAEGWKLDQLEVRNSTHRGISLFDGGQLTNSYIHHNGHLGVKVDGLAGYSGEPTYLTDRGAPVLISNNEIAFNNTANADTGHDAGGLKVWNANNVTVTGNFIHHNTGSGLWFDVDCYYGVIRNNLIEDNTESGIYVEIARRILIESNTVNRNGRTHANDNWRVVAGISVDTSSDVTVRGNVLTNNGNSLIACATTDRSGEGRRWYLQRVVFDSNVVTMDIGRVGRIMDAGARDSQQYADVRFAGNTYTAGSNAGWIWNNWTSQKLSWAQWQALGQQ